MKKLKKKRKISEKYVKIYRGTYETECYTQACYPSNCHTNPC